MRYMIMHKASPQDEAGVPPTPEIIEGVGSLIGEIARTGMFLGGEGLRPSSLGVEVRFANGTRTVTPGPFAGSNELIDRYLIVRVQSIDEAIEWASRFAGSGDAEIGIRPLTEPWDLGMIPKPAGDPTTRYMIMHKADRSTESSTRPTAETRAALRGATGPGTLLSAEALHPSSNATRIRYSGGKRTVVDGPFAESKELVGGFSILQLKSKDDAFEWADRFAGVIAPYGDLEIDIRPLYEPAELS